MDKRTELAMELSQTIYTNTINGLQDRLKEQDEALATLREFASSMLFPAKDTKTMNLGLKLGLIDENGLPTKVLSP
jgi:hypothetical protein